MYQSTRKTAQSTLPLPWPYPGHITGVSLHTVGNLTQNEARLIEGDRWQFWN